MISLQLKQLNYLLNLETSSKHLRSFYKYDRGIRHHRNYLDKQSTQNHLYPSVLTGSTAAATLHAVPELAKLSE
jgi:hypothetical protein